LSQKLGEPEPRTGRKLRPISIPDLGGTDYFTHEKYLVAIDFLPTELSTFH